MSSYNAITRHPNTGKYHLAEWKDNYFGDHLYGVKFPEDDVVYPADQVEMAQLKTFWAQDVIETLRRKTGSESILPFLELLDSVYKARWKRDPISGEGAVEWARAMRGGGDE
jgi:hypothetical protein